MGKGAVASGFPTRSWDKIFLFGSIVGNPWYFWFPFLISRRFFSTKTYFFLPFLATALHSFIFLSGGIFHYQLKWSWSILACRVGMSWPCAAFGNAQQTPLSTSIDSLEKWGDKVLIAFWAGQCALFSIWESGHSSTMGSPLCVGFLPASRCPSSGIVQPREVSSFYKWAVTLS